QLPRLEKRPLRKLKQLRKKNPLKQKKPPDFQLSQEVLASCPLHCLRSSVTSYLSVAYARCAHETET
ncbi:MAG: hypothetical protein VX004_00470, partial [SAR324 cluster bacterium]|nr:hypothetical protein [SAR324 cluster bacterium]